MWLLFEGGSLSTLYVRLLFESGYYSGCGYYSNKYGNFIKNRCRDVSLYKSPSLLFLFWQPSLLHFFKFSIVFILVCAYFCLFTSKCRYSYTIVGQRNEIWWNNSCKLSNLPFCGIVQCLAQGNDEEKQQLVSDSPRSPHVMQSSCLWVCII